MIEQLCKSNGTNLILVNQNIEISHEQELVYDILSVVTHYSAKLYGLRSHKNKKIVKE